MLRNIVLGVALLMLLLQGGVNAAEPIEQRVHHYFSSLKSLQGGFQQQVWGGDGELIEESLGTLLVLRPGRFRWQTQSPYLQEVVGDGERIWIHDPDLEQVTVHPQQEALANTPAALLTDGNSLQQQFVIHPLGQRGNYQWAELAPLRPGGFEQLRVAMDEEQLRIIEVIDSLGQRTRIELLDLMRNITLPEERFRFTPPAGVDVVGEL